MTRSVASAVVDLLQHPPITTDDFQARLTGVNRDAVRRELTHQLLESSIPAQSQLQVVQYLIALGLGNAAVRLLETVGDPSRPLDRRAAAFVVLASQASRELSRCLSSLPAVQIRDLAGGAAALEICTHSTRPSEGARLPNENRAPLRSSRFRQPPAAP